MIFCSSKLRSSVPSAVSERTSPSPWCRNRSKTARRAQDATKKAKPSDPIAVALLAAHNREREKKGLGPLKLSEKLSEAAAVHAKDMAEHQKLDHTGSDKSKVAERVKRTGYPYVLVGENIADGQNPSRR